jgi:rubredoxin
MSAVRRCDLCGEIFENHMGDIKRSRIEIWNDKNYEEHDACPHCTEQLRLFMDVLKNGEDYHIYIGQKEE